MIELPPCMIEKPAPATKVNIDATKAQKKFLAVAQGVCRVGRATAALDRDEQKCSRRLFSSAAVRLLVTDKRALREPSRDRECDPRDRRKGRLAGGQRC